MNTSLIAFILIEGLAEGYASFRELFGKLAFQRFFGKTAVKNGVRLVFADRRLGSEFIHKNVWDFASGIQSISGDAVPKQVEGWVPFTDLDGATELYTEFQEYIDKSNEVKFIHDTSVMKEMGMRDLDGPPDFQKLKFCYVSMGLGFNAFTHLLAGRCNNHLFTIKFAEVPEYANEDKTYNSDYFSLEGAEIKPDEDGFDCALIARVVWPERPGFICFVCAGRTAPGTRVAGKILAEKWKDFYRHYKKHHTVVLVRHKHGEESTVTYLPPKSASE